MNYQNYNIEDFIRDESFVRWVLNEDFDTSEQWNEFLDRFPEKREDVQLAIDLVLKIRPGVSESEMEKDTLQIWDSLNHKLTHKSFQKHKPKSGNEIFNSKWLQVAAIFVLVSGLSTVIYLSNNVYQEPFASADEVSKVVKFNPKGRKSSIMLSDRTRVELNAQSRIEYQDQFSPDIREVTLTGEAFFDVQRDESRPFVINVNGITVKVLGTSFNIKGYPGDDRIQVAVASGQVEVFDITSKNSVNLVKNELADYSYTSGNFSKNEISDSELVFGWKDQKLVFRDQDLKSITEELSRWYGVEVRMEVMEPSKRITGVYQNASLWEVMEGLSHNYQIKYELNAKVLRIYN